MLRLYFLISTLIFAENAMKDNVVIDKCKNFDMIKPIIYF